MRQKKLDKIEKLDNKNWYKLIGYTPQFIFLTDDTILRNIAFGTNEENLQLDEVKKAYEILESAQGVEILEDLGKNRFPMPQDVNGRDPISVGRIRQDISNPNALELWLCGDQIRKGAALNAVQIAELLLPKKS